MRLLLDTHILLWWLSDDPRLGVRQRGLIADPAQDVLVSVVSLWEIVVKRRIGKLTADIGEVMDAGERAGFVRLGIEPRHLQVLAELPTHHRDPFDHLLIAQAIAEDVVFVTDDRHAVRYPVRLLGDAPGTSG